MEIHETINLHFNELVDVKTILRIDYSNQNRNSTYFSMLNFFHNVKLMDYFNLKFDSFKVPHDKHPDQIEVKFSWMWLVLV